MYVKQRRAACLPLAFAVLLLVLYLAWAAPARAAVNLTAPQAYTVINTVKLENRSARSIYNIRLSVPLADVQGADWQTVLGEEFSPSPVDITVDDEGRRVGHYVIRELKSGQTLDLVQRVAVRNYCISYDIDVTDMLDGDLPADVAPYLLATADVNCESAVIRDFAAAHSSSTTNPYLKARLLFAAVNSYMTYDNADYASHSAVSAYYRKRGNCEDYANLYAALLRAEGIPARVVSGYLYGTEAQHSSAYVAASGHIDADKMRHSWVMFYIGGVGWLPADPTFSYTTFDTADEDGGGVVDWSRFAQITHGSRLVYTGDQLAGNNLISYEYQGAAPLISYSSEMALYSLIAPFRDIVDHWASDAVLGLYYHQPQLVTGLADGYFGVNDTLTRAELATLLNRVLDSVDGTMDAPGDVSNNAVDTAFNEVRRSVDTYSDLRTEHWAYDEVNKAVARGIISGYPDGTVRPDAKVTRAEAAVMLARVTGYMAETPPKDPLSTPQAYRDVEGYAWATSAIYGLYDSGLMRGVDAEHFAPGQEMTRGEGATVIYRWIKSDDFKERFLGL